MTEWVIGVDVGGTFTDFSARSMANNCVYVHKRPSTPDDPSQAILDGLCELLDKAGIAGSSIGRIAHGTTVATNALLQRDGAQVGVVTTRGFRDLLEIGRQVRPKIYDLQEDASAPLALRQNRLEITERVGADGSIVVPMSDSDVDVLINQVRLLEGVESIAVCMLFSFLNPAHEQRVALALRAAFPDIFVSVSSDVQPEFREYERFSTTAINAFLQPEVSRYMDRLSAAIEDVAPNAKLGIFQSSGGLMSVSKASEFPVRTALSGPAAGAVGAAAAGKISGIQHIITLDMGGRSTDVCLIRNGTTEISNMRDIAGFRIRLPMVDIHTVGAGGGSIAFVGADGLMKVGPASAGAVPGPACYGKGGVLPTVSDANVVLGRLPETLAGGLVLSREKAVESIQKIAELLDLSVVETALGILGIVTSNMTRAIRAVSTEKGHDPRNFTLMPFGGAGGLHAADVAKALGLSRVMIPNAPGILCADGLIEADLQENFVATCRSLLSDGLRGVEQALAGLNELADDWIANETDGSETTQKIVSVDMRYVGQNYELPIVISNSPDAPVIPSNTDLLEGFFEAHQRSYGYVDRDAPVEVMNVRLQAVSPLSQTSGQPESPQGLTSPELTQDVWFAADTPLPTPIYRRDTLSIGTIITGPAIISQFDATTVVPPDATLTVDHALNMILELHYV